MPLVKLHTGISSQLESLFLGQTRVVMPQKQSSPMPSVLLKLSSPWDLSDMRLWSQSLSPFSSAHTGESRASLSPGRPLFYHCWWIGSAWLGSNRAFAQTGLASSLSARLHGRMCTKMTYDELGTPNLKFRVYRHVHKWGIKCLIQPSWGTQAML